MAAVGAAVGSFTMGGLVGSLVAYRRGEAVAVPLFFDLGLRYWGRMLGLAGVALLLSLAVSLLLIIPPIGFLALVLASPLVAIYCGFYPAYLIVAEEMGVTRAIGACVGALGRNFKEAVMGGGLLLFMYVVLGMGCLVAAFIPLVGPIADVALACLGMVVIVYYYTDRFEANIRPLLNG